MLDAGSTIPALSNHLVKSCNVLASTVFRMPLGEVRNDGFLEERRETLLYQRQADQSSLVERLVQHSSQ